MAWQPAQLTFEQKEERRMAAARLLEDGWLQRDIAEELGVSEAAVSGWAKKFRSGGNAALKAKKNPGAPSRLTPAQWEELGSILKAGAIAAGFETERWTLLRIARVIKKRFGVRYHPNYLSEPLHRQGFSVQRPKTQAKERNDALIWAWLKHDWESVKRGLSEAGVRLPSWTRQVTRFGPP